MEIAKISSQNFKGVYMSNSLAPGKQRELGKQIQSLFNSSGLANDYEKENKDILIKSGPKGSINIAAVKHSIKRILDDNYSRWNGRF